MEEVFALLLRAGTATWPNVGVFAIYGLLLLAVAAALPGDVVRPEKRPPPRSGEIRSIADFLRRLRLDVRDSSHPRFYAAVVALNVLAALACFVTAGLLLWACVVGEAVP